MASDHKPNTPMYSVLHTMQPESKTDKPVKVKTKAHSGHRRRGRRVVRTFR